MKMPNFITKNFWIKIFCLLLASGLWFYIAAGQNTVGKFPGSIKIKAINTPSGLVAIYDAKTVDIKVTADPTTWRKLSADTFSAYIDLSAHSEGTYELPVSVVSSIPGVQIVEKNPDRILVSLEPLISKTVTVNKKVEGSAAEGLVAGSIELNPSQVEVKGPKSVVENLTEATAVIRLNGETENFSKTVSIVAFNEEGTQISNLDFVPGEVQANVPIIQASNNKTVGVKVKTAGQPKVGYYISEVVVTPSTVDITGPLDLLSKINYVETFAVDVANLSSSLEKEVQLNLNNGVALQPGIASTIKVNIKASPADSSIEIAPTVSVKNLDSAYAVTSISPKEVQVVCAGPLDLIGSLKPSDVLLFLDFSNKKIVSGTAVNFDLSAKDFQTPSSIFVSSIVPSSISVVVEKKR